MAFHEKLTEIQRSQQDIIERASNPSSHPEAIESLAAINSIVQSQKGVALLGAIVTELQSGKVQVSQWIDARGVYFTQAVDGSTVHTYNASGEVYIPVEPCRPANAAAKTSLPSIPKFRRVVGMEQVVVGAGKYAIGISVRSGEVSSGNGGGVLKSGDAITWTDNDGGLGEISFVGADADTEYLITIREPSPTPAIAPTPTLPTAVADEQLPMTSELLPAPTP